MADKPDWFKMDPGKFLQDGLVDAMTTLELGCAMRLLCRQWADGFIPDDLDLLARLCRLDRSAMGEAWVILSKFFPEIEPGKRANRFMWIERETVLAAMSKRRDDGRAAVERRWEKTREAKEKVSNRSPIPNQIQESESESEPEQEKKSPLPPKGGRAVDRVLGIWNEATKGKLAQARATPKREKAIQAALRDPGWLEDFQAACAFISTSPHHLGRNERGWVATIDFLLQKGKATEIADRFRASPRPPEPMKNHARTETDAAYLRQIEERDERIKRNETLTAKGSDDEVPALHF